VPSVFATAYWCIKRRTPPWSRRGIGLVSLTRVRRHDPEGVELGSPTQRVRAQQRSLRGSICTVTGTVNKTGGYSAAMPGGLRNLSHRLTMLHTVTNR